MKVTAAALMPLSAFTLRILTAEWTDILFAPESDVSIIMTVGQYSCGHWPVSVDDVFDHFLLSVRHATG
jgi:hypothetical protein